MLSLSLLPLLIENVLTWIFLEVSLELIVIFLVILAVLHLLMSFLHLVSIDGYDLVVLHLALVSPTRVKLLQRCLLPEIVSIALHPLRKMHPLGQFRIDLLLLRNSI